MASLACELVTDFARLDQLAPEWERLEATAAGGGGIFLTWRWARATWSTRDADLALCTPVVFEDGHVIGLMPMAIRRGVLQPLSAPFSDYNGLLVGANAGAVASTALAALVDAARPWSEVVLDGIPESSSLLEAGADVPRRVRARQQVVFGSMCPVTVNDDGGVFERMSRKESLRRHEKRLARRGTLRFRHIEDRTEILGHLDEFVRFQVTRHAAQGIRSAWASPAGRALLAALVSELDPSHELRFAVLEVQGRPAAYHFGFQYAGRFTYYVPAFDIRLADDGPGEVMLRNLLQYAHGQQLREFDFTVGDERYKSRFATHVRRTFTMYLYRHPYRPYSAAQRMARAVRDAARRQPAVIACARPTLRVMHRLAASLRS